MKAVDSESDAWMFKLCGSVLSLLNEKSFWFTLPKTNSYSDRMMLASHTTYGIYIKFCNIHWIYFLLNFWIVRHILIQLCLGICVLSAPFEILLLVLFYLFWLFHFVVCCYALSVVFRLIGYACCLPKSSQNTCLMLTLYCILINQQFLASYGA